MEVEDGVLVGLLVPPADIKPILAYMMLIPIVGGVGLACVKEGKGIEINVPTFMYAFGANVAAALKGKLGGSVTKALKGNPKKNMDSANVYAVVNIISFLCTVPMVVVAEMSTLPEMWEAAVAEHGSGDIIKNIALSGLFFYVYNEFTFPFTPQVGAVTSSVLNTAKIVCIKINYYNLSNIIDDAVVKLVIFGYAVWSSPHSKWTEVVN